MSSTKLRLVQPVRRFRTWREKQACHDCHRAIAAGGQRACYVGRVAILCESCLEVRRTGYRQTDLDEFIAKALIKPGRTG